MPDGTGPKNAPLAKSVRAQRDLRARQGRLTWADEFRAVALQVLAEDDPASLHEALVRTSDVVGAWLGDLESRGTAGAAGTEPARRRSSG